MLQQQFIQEWTTDWGDILLLRLVFSANRATSAGRYTHFYLNLARIIHGGGYALLLDALCINDLDYN